MHDMNRREVLKNLGGTAAVTAALVGGGDAYWRVFGKPTPLEAAQSAARRGLPPLKITDIKPIRMKVGNQQLMNVKVYTSEPGLYGVGDGNHAERPYLIAMHMERFLKPWLIGRDAGEIEDIWQTAWVSTYWRSGVDMCNAIAAIDSALWDILGKRAGMPLYQLFGGKVREGCRMFTGGGGDTPQELEDGVRAGMELGYKHFRLRKWGPSEPWPGSTEPPRGLDVDARMIRQFVAPFEHLRNTVGWDIELACEVHNNLHPTGALMLAKALEPYRPFFIEDIFTPENVEWYRVLRQQSAVGIAMGETFAHQLEWIPLVEDRLMDFMRAHISAFGGLNMARKVAAMCEFFEVRTAWHGPGNVSPIGHAVNLNLDLALYNFGIGEGRNFSDQLKELYPGLPEIRNGIRYRVNDDPGLGVDIDEKVAAKYVPTDPGRNRGAWSVDGEPRRP